jgi:hypothetical protein
MGRPFPPEDFDVRARDFLGDRASAESMFQSTLIFASRITLPSAYSVCSSSRNAASLTVALPPPG